MTLYERDWQNICKKERKIEKAISSPASIAANAKKFDRNQYNSEDEEWMTGRTDFIYKGEILTGICYRRYSGYYTEGKYITKNYPNLSLPVSGPSYTWDV